MASTDYRSQRTIGGLVRAKGWKALLSGMASSLASQLPQGSVVFAPMMTTQNVVQYLLQHFIGQHWGSQCWSMKI
jgi:hypothetical protein